MRLFEAKAPELSPRGLIEPIIEHVFKYCQNTFAADRSLDGLPYLSGTVNRCSEGEEIGETSGE